MIVQIREAGGFRRCVPILPLLLSHVALRDDSSSESYSSALGVSHHRRAPCSYSSDDDTRTYAASSGLASKFKLPWEEPGVSATTALTRSFLALDPADHGSSYIDIAPPT
jgi:hypothetical protein